VPIFRITVVDPPSEFGEYGRVKLLLQMPDRLVEPIRPGVFEILFKLKPDRSGAPQPTGPAVQRGSDGRRFVYLCWLSAQGVMFRRLKVFFDTATGFPEDLAIYEVHVNGRDKRGGPACATAQIVS